MWRPDQTGIATILPCLFAHNLVFDTYDLKFELNYPANVCDLVLTKFTKINRSQTFLVLQYS